MRKRSVGGIAASLALACILLLGGCQSMEDLLKSAPKPTVRIAAVSLRGLTLEKVDLVFDVEVSNPYAVSLPLLDLGYSIGSSGHQIVEGSAQPAGTIPAHGAKVIQLPAGIKFAALMSALQNVRPGSVVPYQADFSLGVDAPVVGRLNLPFSHTGEVPVPAVPEVSLDSLDVGALSLDRVEATARLHVRNTNPFALDLSKLGLNLTLGGKEVSRTKLAQGASLAPGQSGTIEVPLSFSPRAFGMGLFNMLSGKQASYSISGSVEANTRFGPLALPFSKSGNTSLSK